ncbi:Hypothetical protein PBC10988_15510 [Planctomycetales bacterium 10988]|nr:Hypothetical protein PBC10988_15510 [Planctomycetales bacterium 10988]
MKYSPKVLFATFIAANMGFANLAVAQYPCPTCPTCPPNVPSYPGYTEVMPSTPLPTPPEPMEVETEETTEIPPAPEVGTFTPPPMPAPSTPIQQVTTTASSQTTLLPNTFGDIFDTGTYLFNGATIVTSPGGGGVVGRNKISEASNPIPRDRFFFNFDYFSETQLSPEDPWVARFSPGLERTILCGAASIEARLPFAATFDADFSTTTADDRDFELGNLQFIFKGILYNEEGFYFTGGTGLVLPTASDADLFDPFTGEQLLTIENESVLLEPYLAIVMLPTDRTFVQLWTQASFDVRGSEVFASEPMIGTPLTSFNEIGRLQSANLLQFDVQVGYWLMEQSNCRCKRGLFDIDGLAVFAEYHYNTTIGTPDFIGSPGSASTLVSTSGSIDEMNLTLGGTALIGDRSSLALGVVLPLKGGDDERFDYQLGVRYNLYFGDSVRQRNRTVNMF